MKTFPISRMRAALVEYPDVVEEAATDLLLQVFARGRPRICSSPRKVGCLHADAVQHLDATEVVTT